MRVFASIILGLTATFTIAVQAEPTASALPAPAWEKWSPDVFARAKKENKFVLLDLGTSWCHWCHVMDAETYADPAVRKLIADKFIPVQVDADSRPDLADRYEDYGWPATIVYNADGGEIVRQQGYLNPKVMASVLEAIIKDPTPGPSVTGAKGPMKFSNVTTLKPEIQKAMLKAMSDTFDAKRGSWGKGQNFLDWDNTEWCLRQAAAGDKQAEQMARAALDGQLNLIDPAWGGVYQYSTDNDWQHPHFEKIMQMQAENLRIYSMAYAQFKDPAYLKAAQAIHHYLVTFLQAPNGAFYTSQDADLVDGVHSADYFKLSDADRRAKGIPRIDQHQYARENGWAIRGLTVYYESTGDQSALAEAIAAANWVIQHRAMSYEGYTHDEHDSAGPYVGDSLAMGQAFLQLYEATADRKWLTKADRTSDFISGHFLRVDMPAAVITAEVHAGNLFGPGLQIDENIGVARWANLLSQYSGRAGEKTLADAAMRYLATPDVASSRKVQVGGILLAGDESAQEPLHLAIVGKKSDATAAELFHQAGAFPRFYKRVEWYDASEGPLPNSDVKYPKLPKPAAFVCTGSACSTPAYTPEQLSARLSKAH